MKIKRFYILIAALALVFFPYFPISADEIETPIINTPIKSQRELQDAINGLDISGGEIWLSQDLTLSSTLYFPLDNAITIDGKGHKLIMAAGVESRHISISANNTRIMLKNLALEGHGNGKVGGGISVNGKLEMEDMVLENNFAPNGGGMIISGGSVLAKRSTFKGNSSYGNGGGIHISSSGVLAIYDSEVKGNTATRGGGIYAIGGKSSQYTIYADNTNFTANKAQTNGNDIVAGGAIAADGENTGIKLVEGTIGENVSANIGGGVYAGGMLEATDTVFKANEAEGNGGGAYLAHKAIIEGGKLVLNTSAGNGGGMYAETKVLNFLSIQDTEFGDNKAACHIIWDTEAKTDVESELYALLLANETVKVKGFTGKGNVFNDSDINILAKSDVIFAADGGTWADGSTENMAVPHYLGDPINAPEGLKKDGNTAAGWKTEDGTVMTVKHRVTGYVTLYPIWQGEQDAEDGQDEAQKESTPVEESAEPEEAAQEQTQPEQAQPEQTRQQTPAPEVKEPESQAKTYVVIFMLEGGTETRSEKYTEGSLLKEPPVQYNNHKLIGWFVEGTDRQWDFAKDTINDDIMLTAKWERIAPQLSAVDLLNQ